MPHSNAASLFFSYFFSMCVYIYRDAESAALERVASAEEVLDRLLSRRGGGRGTTARARR